MARTKTYSLKAKKVAYNLKTRKIVPLGMANKQCIVFDSQHEFKVWKTLVLEKKHDIKVHEKIPHLKWYVDFTLDYSKHKGDDWWFDLFEPRLHKGRYLYIDAKGIITREIINQIKAYPETVQKSIVLITQKTTDMGKIGQTSVIPLSWIATEPPDIEDESDVRTWGNVTLLKTAKRWR